MNGCFQTDVIVNTTSKQNWNGGQISRALLQKAGTKMEDELNTASMKEYFMVTKSYKLLCKEVYHTFCTDRFTDNSDQVQYDFNCYGAFKLADVCCFNLL